MPPEDRDPRNSVFTDRRQIAVLLGRVLHARSLLSVSREPGEAHTSLLLDVAPLRGCLLLDAPVPPLIVSAGALLTVSGRLEGGRFAFRTSVEAPSLAADDGVLQLAFPERLHFRERRGSFRLPLTPQLALPPSDFSHDTHVFRARLADISRLGADAVVTNDPGTSEGTVLSCLLRLAGMSLPALAEVRSREPQGAQTRLGLRLVDLTPAQDTLLSAEINALQRRRLRNRS